MSNKNTKINIKIPVYDLQGQLNFINSLCSDLEFDPQKLITLIIADWICNFQEISSVQGPYKAFVSFLQTSEKTSQKLKELKDSVEKEFDNGQK